MVTAERYAHCLVGGPWAAGRYAHCLVGGPWAAGRYAHCLVGVLLGIAQHA